MDYSQVLASQLMRQNTWVDDEEAFYSELSLERFARLRGAFQKMKSWLVRSERPARAANSQASTV